MEGNLQNVTIWHLLLVDKPLRLLHPSNSHARILAGQAEAGLQLQAEAKSEQPAAAVQVADPPPAPSEPTEYMKNRPRRCRRADSARHRAFAEISVLIVLMHAAGRQAHEGLLSGHAKLCCVVPDCLCRTVGAG